MEINGIDFLLSFEFNKMAIFTILANLIFIVFFLIMFFLCDRKINKNIQKLNKGCIFADNNSFSVLKLLIILRTTDNDIMKMKNIGYGLVLLSMLLNSIIMFVHGIDFARGIIHSNGSDGFLWVYLIYTFCLSFITLIMILLNFVLIFIIGKKLQKFDKFMEGLLKAACENN